MKVLKLSAFALLAGTVALSSCKKVEPELRDEKVGGCLNENSPLYNADADFDDESCEFAYVNAYEITYHPQEDDGGDWDGFPTFGNDVKADLILRIKPEGATDWMFESATIDNQTYNEPANWTAPDNIKLLNQNYFWEVYDYDSTNGDDLVASGTFNPIELASGGTIITIGVNDHGDESQLILTYELKE